MLSMLVGTLHLMGRYRSPSGRHRDAPGMALGQAAWTAGCLYPQITLDLEDSSISTKGTKSGAFVMYNCARLATLFDTYQRAVERGEHWPCLLHL